MIVAPFFSMVTVAFGSLKDVNDCLDRYDVPCAEQALTAMGAERST